MPNHESRAKRFFDLIISSIFYSRLRAGALTQCLRRS